VAIIGIPIAMDQFVLGIATMFEQSSNACAESKLLRYLAQQGGSAAGSPLRPIFSTAEHPTAY
jgi:hypothetical protein